MPCLAIVLIYCSITFVWNLLSLDLNDAVFLFLVAAFIISIFRRPLRIKSSLSGEVLCIIAMTAFAIVQFIRAQLSLKQSAFENFLTIREILYILVALPFAFSWITTEKCIRWMVKLELIGAFLYFICFLMKAPISPFAYFPGSSVLIGQNELYRDFCPIPLLTMFICPYIAFGIANRRYIWNRRRDMFCLIAICVTLGLHMFRTRMFVLAIELIVTAVISLEKQKRKNILKRINRAFGILILLSVIAVAVPSIRQRFLEGIRDIAYAMSGNELNPYNGTFTYRMWLFSFRIQYLLENNMLMFGMGAISSRDATAYFGNDSLLTSMATVYNPDNAYMTLLSRYGIFGIVFYVGILIILMVLCFKKRSKLSICTAMYIGSMLIEGLSGNSALCEYSLILIGMLVGLCMSEKNSMQRSRLNWRER